MIVYDIIHMTFSNRKGENATCADVPHIIEIVSRRFNQTSDLF